MISVFHPSLHRIAGAERVCLDIIEAVSRSHDTRLFVIDPSVDEDTRHTLDAQGVEIRTLRAANRISQRGPLSKFTKLVANIELSVAETGTQLISTKWLLFIPRSHGVYFHNPERIWKLDQPTWWVLRPVYLLMKLYLKLLHTLFEVTVVVNSRWTREELRKQGFEADTVVYPKIHQSMSGEFTGGGRILTLGRLVPDKRLIPIIEVVSALIEDFPGTELAVVGFEGDPEYERELRRLETTHEWLEVKKNVHADTLSRLLDESDVYVHGKHAEHYGMSVAEALISGCVCLVHDSGGQVEIVGGDPAYTYTDDVDLAAKLARILDGDQDAIDTQQLEALRSQIEVQRQEFAAHINEHLVS
jgi:glycosyltransferase involved in cell wall biosynthesis